MMVIGNYIVHSGHGVCTIVDKKYNESMNKNFFYLKTISNNMSIMIPEDKVDGFLRPILTKDECLSILDSTANLEINYKKDNKERKNQFQYLITSNNLIDTLHLLKNLYALSEEKKKEKKTLGSFDTQFFQQAYRKATDEISIVLEISKSAADELITSKLKSLE